MLERADLTMNVAQRWFEHIRQAKVWNSKTSRKRFSSRRSPLYAAMASQWASLIAVVASVGDRALAAKLARHARYACPKHEGCVLPLRL